ncbi:MAG: PHP domain-containing protein [Candidatus Accumulibacter sp.]|nr:PHP domain-containing protein [Accumulibacter sp.]
MSFSVQVVDLHSHSQASDGLLSPAEVVARAAARGVDMLALTDHDETSGLSPARAAAESTRLRFIDGVEISAEWGSIQVHVVGLDIDAHDATLNAELKIIRSGRIERARRMAAELEASGIPECFAGAVRHADNPNLINRSHFARYLVEIGICRDVRSVFDSYLVPGKPGYVNHQWAKLGEAIDWIHGAGGIAVLAHPGRYKLSRLEMRALLDEFKSLGGQAIEVIFGNQMPEHFVEFARLAREYEFLGSCGSDFHGPKESYVDLGANAPLPDGITPVWTAFR